tara:strand:- start:3165 stop:4097 length:933 start_codon:yes stop_codon:yes gene_type:complete
MLVTQTDGKIIRLPTIPNQKWSFIPAYWKRKFNYNFMSQPVPNVHDIPAVAEYVERNIATVEDSHQGSRHVYFLLGSGPFQEIQARLIQSTDQLIKKFDMKLIGIQRNESRVTKNTIQEGLNEEEANTIDEALENYPFLKYALTPSMTCVGVNNSVIEEGLSALGCLRECYYQGEGMVDKLDREMWKDACKQGHNGVEAYLKTDFSDEYDNMLRQALQPIVELFPFPKPPELDFRVNRKRNMFECPFHKQLDTLGVEYLAHRGRSTATQAISAVNAAQQDRMIVVQNFSAIPTIKNELKNKGVSYVELNH